MSIFKIRLNGRVVAIEFGVITKVPGKTEGGQHVPDAVAYARGEYGARDAYIPMFSGFHVTAGDSDCPNLTDRKLKPHLMIGDKVGWIRSKDHINDASCWCLGKFYDLAILQAAEKPQASVVEVDVPAPKAAVQEVIVQQPEPPAELPARKLGRQKGRWSDFRNLGLTLEPGEAEKLVAADTSPLKGTKNHSRQDPRDRRSRRAYA